MLNQKVITTLPDATGVGHDPVSDAVTGLTYTGTLLRVLTRAGELRTYDSTGTLVATITGPQTGLDLPSGLTLCR